MFLGCFTFHNEFYLYFYYFLVRGYKFNFPKSNGSPIRVTKSLFFKCSLQLKWHVFIHCSLGVISSGTFFIKIFLHAAYLFYSTCDWTILSSCTTFLPCQNNKGFPKQILNNHSKRSVIAIKFSSQKMVGFWIYVFFFTKGWFFCTLFRPSNCFIWVIKSNSLVILDFSPIMWV